MPSMRFKLALILIGLLYAESAPAAECAEQVGALGRIFGTKDPHIVNPAVTSLFNIFSPGVYRGVDPATEDAMEIRVSKRSGFNIRILKMVVSRVSLTGDRSNPVTFKMKDSDGAIENQDNPRLYSFYRDQFSDRKSLIVEVKLSSQFEATPFQQLKIYSRSDRLLLQIFERSSRFRSLIELSSVDQIQPIKGWKSYIIRSNDPHNPAASLDLAAQLLEKNKRDIHIIEDGDDDRPGRFLKVMASPNAKDFSLTLPPSFYDIRSDRP
jgi:hypothetical protein